MLRKLLILTLAFLALAIFAQADDEDAGEDHYVESAQKHDFAKMTCGSVIKIMHAATNQYLHSHDIAYGTGSGQQSITGNLEASDPNSYWLLQAAHDQTCLPGAPIKCGDVIRITHLQTKKNLHSHLFKSPLSGNQEVSAYGANGVGDTGDNWRVECVKTTAFWLREEEVRFLHVDTGKYLHSTSQKYQRPIAGQFEVCAKDTKNKQAQWKADQGVYYPDRSSHYEN
eukprot:TRINITY_DN5475_c0_g1::TRINITY_DN5475_c0_g1_i1::g.26734::m.26734 TRINITY_DN5475_c0_g1::TRINITY_DN5475_c0_g1_i1::g.26734  ORF type:complete len:227 (-),score=53.01,sp/Q9DCT5/SDF2_MOUSE/48.88/6e-55,MIR/PF02815.14/0.0085,MIR/PF02815.14/4.4e-10,MIR/PF02815.14/0.0005,His_binding/PF02098.11/1e+03,His_binding/PF02098.11/0.3,His_binding/PF02098.11/1.5e+02,N36/PF11438.3/0.18 TRINITY_DN5475_c0_g1_i1:103-783(-)